IRIPSMATAARVRGSAGVRFDATFAVYGLNIGLRGDWPEVIEELALDFGWFPCDTGHHIDVDIDVRRGPPEYDAFGELEATYVTPRNVVFQYNGRRVVDYFGRALSVLDAAGNKVLIQGDEKHLVHEAAYHFLL